ncbi:aminoglycoside phosphotransferase family protein [Micromonospora sp. DT81.3]|uniref:aminoglycoside phosphotransferase family protein n=1 Tax=Micromonospora sp. DT81.3 TaxID=3416523 RepID=UPI003CEA85C1
MPDKPAAEVIIDSELVRGLLAGQYPQADGLALSHAADGWDCSVWRLGSDRAVRLPRRAVAAPLVLHEQQWLPAIAQRIRPTGIEVPAPVFAGGPTEDFPWSWSIVPWIDGGPGLALDRRDRAGWAQPLAAALEALHVAAPDDHPRNPFRGAPLSERADAVRERIGHLGGTLGAADLRAVSDAWAAGLAADPWAGVPVWIHGDLHPGNVITAGSALAGIIDFGDVTAGDPAYDLAVAWLAFDAPARKVFVEACGTRVDAATWTRARAWAAAVTLMLLAHSDDNPSYAALGRECLAELAQEPDPTRDAEER